MPSASRYYPEMGPIRLPASAMRAAVTVHMATTAIRRPPHAGAPTQASQQIIRDDLKPPRKYPPNGGKCECDIPHHFAGQSEE